MSNHYDDRKIASEFHQLRQIERQHTPSFSSQINNANGTQPRYRLLHPMTGFAVVVLSLSLVAGILLRPGNTGHTPASPHTLQYAADTLQLSPIDEMPTDFLLETPWSQLASLGSGTPLLDLPVEFLEDLPDEP